MNPQELSERARRHLLESAEVKRQSAEVCIGGIVEAAELVAAGFRSGGKVLLCGNGGSAADSQHIAAEFVSALRRNFQRPALPAIALTTDTSFLTANANDFGFEGGFARQVEALGRSGDVLIAISTSGNSENVVRAVELANGIGLRTIGVTGGGGGRLRGIATTLIRVPSEDTGHIQEAHIAIAHAFCDLVERILYGPYPATAGGQE